MMSWVSDKKAIMERTEMELLNELKPFDEKVMADYVEIEFNV